MRQSQLKSPDPWGRTFQMDEQTLASAAMRLEARGRHPFFAHVLDEYVSGLGLSGTEAVLDLGCGTGLAARAFARRSEMKGPITAVDVSPHLVEAGRRAAAGEGLGGRIDFRAGDAHRLDLPESSFDVAVMHTLISHVVDPVAVLAEARRLLRPGSGRLVIFDGDHSSLTFATGAPDGGEATDRILQRTGVAHPRVMRAMPRLLAQARLVLLWSRGYVVADIGRANFFAPGIASLRVLLPKAGAMSETKAAAFVERLERASAENSFFGASNFYTYVARRDD